MDWKLLRRAVTRQWIAIAACLAVGALVAFYLSHKTRDYAASASVVLADANTQPSQNSTEAAHLSVQVIDLPALAQSTTVLSRVAHDLHGSATVASIRAHLSARVAQGATIMPITFTDRDPDVAVAGVNAVANELTTFDREVTTARFDSLIGDLRRQVESRRVELARLDAQISSAAIAHPLVDSKSGVDAVNARIVELRSKRDDAIAQMNGDRAAASILAQLLDDTRALARKENGDADPVYQNLRTQYAKDAAQLARVRATFSKSYPGLPELVNQNRREQRQVADAQARVDAVSPFSSKSYADALRDKLGADAKVTSDLAQIQTYQSQLDADMNDVAGMSNANNSLAALRREREVASDAYNQLSTRLTTALADRAQAASLGSIAVIDSASTAERGSAATARIVGIVVLFASLWAGVGLALLLETLREETSAEKLATDLYGAPVYATVRG